MVLQVDEVLRFERNATEYFLIENRFRSGRDSALPASGLAVWHIDESGNNQKAGTADVEPNLVTPRGFCVWAPSHWPATPRISKD